MVPLIFWNTNGSRIDRESVSFWDELLQPIKARNLMNTPNKSAWKQLDSCGFPLKTACARPNAT